MAERDDPVLGALLEALTRSIDPERLRAELGARLSAPQEGGPQQGEVEMGSTASGVGSRVLERFAMADLLDDSILGARPGQGSFPLRLFFGSLSERADEELAFALGSALNFFFRAEMDEETRARVGLEASRLYYRFAAETAMEAKLRREVSPLLARLLTTQLERLRLEAVDHVPVFDSEIHERSAGSDGTRAAVSEPLSFLCRIAGNDRVKQRALVRT